MEPEFSLESVVTICPRCKRTVLTTVKYEIGMRTHLSALVLGCYFCCILPYYLDACKNINHYCPYCRKIIGKRPLQYGIGAAMATTDTTRRLTLEVDYHPMEIICPGCCQRVFTIIEYNPSPCTHCWAIFSCLFFLWPCIILPYCLAFCQDRNHYCPNCFRYIGTYKKKRDDEDEEEDYDEARRRSVLSTRS